jgi:hypothetical protein
MGEIHQTDFTRTVSVSLVKDRGRKTEEKKNLKKFQVGKQDGSKIMRSMFLNKEVIMLRKMQNILRLIKPFFYTN